MTEEEKLDYLAGFFDAEGCVYFSSNRQQQQVMYAAFQSDPTALYLFQEMFGGSVRKRYKATEKHKEGWMWGKVCDRLDKFGPAMIGRTVIKKRQLELAVEFSGTLRARGSHKRTITEAIITHRNSIREMLSAAKETYFDNDGCVVPEMPIAYWAGLFDGDGAAGTWKSKRCFYPKSAIYSSYVPVLESAKRQFAGSIFVNKTKRAREWRGIFRTAEAFLRRVEPYLIVKAEVVRKVLSISDLTANSRRLMVCDARGMNRSFPNSVILEMESLAGEVREMNRFGPKTGAV